MNNFRRKATRPASKKSAPVPAKTNIPKTAMKRHWDEFLALDGMFTSEMDDYQKRLVEFFTQRSLVGTVWKRKVDTYIIPTLVFLEITEGKSALAEEYRIDIIEDEEIYFDPQPSTANIVDVAFFSLDDETYVPTRSRQDKDFERILIYRDEMRTTFSNNFRGNEIAFSEKDLTKMPKKLSELSEFQLNLIYSDKETEYLGDYIRYKDQDIEIDTVLMPTKTSTCAIISMKLQVELVAYSRNEWAKAPRYIAIALAYLKDNPDDLNTDYLGGIGNHNNISEIPNQPPTRGIKSRTLQYATEFLYRDYGRKSFSS